MDISKDENDFYVSIEKAFDEIDPNWRDYKGLVIGGSHAPTSVEEKLEKIKIARENKIPFLGICMGMELMIIEYARNMLGLEGANSTEINPNTLYPVVVKMPYLRVGKKPAHYWGRETGETFWHHYKFNKNFAAQFKNWDINYRNGVTCMMSLLGQPFYGVQFHPEYQSSRSKPHPVLKHFIEVCKQRS